MLRPILLSILYFLAFNGLAAQTWRAYVVDADTGDPLVGASVWPSTNPQHGTQTDGQGFFELAMEGDSLQVSYLGYEAWRGRVSTEETMRLSLVPLSTQVAQITVRAERRPARFFATEQLKRLDVYLNAAAKADVLLAVNSLPAATNPDETANVSLRGNPYASTGIFVNNVPLYDAVRLDQPNGVGQFSIFNTAIVTGLDVYPSNPPVYLGLAHSGALAIRTVDKIMGNSTAVNLHLAGAGVQVSRQLGEQTGFVGYLNWGNHRLLKGTNSQSLSDIESFASADAGFLLTHQLTERSNLVFFNLYLRERYQYWVQSDRFLERFDQRKDRNLSILNYNLRGNNWHLSWNQGLNW
ncbi:MAG: carboxypeptidase-like regulatory domain-containing protein, partial [Bacteroidota bacterium]